MQLKGTAPQTKFSMFCVLSQTYQHFLKNDVNIPKRIVWGTQLKNALKISVVQVVLELLIKICKIFLISRGDPGELSHKESWSTPIIFKTSHLFDLFFLE